MTEILVTIPELRHKLKFLIVSESAKKVGRHSGSEVAFAKAIGVPRITARDWINVETRRPTIPTTVNNTIATRFGFPADWSPWLTLSTEMFKQEYETLARKLLNERLPPSQPRNTNLPLKLGPDREIDRGPVRGLASIELTCGNTGRGETVIGVNINCGDAIIAASPYPITVRSGELEIDCGHARATSDSVKGAAEGTSARFDSVGNDGVVRCKWNGDFQSLRWNLDATGASIGTLIFEPGVLAKIVQLAPGDVIKGTFGTYLKDIVSNDSEPPRLAEEITIVDRLGEPPALAGEHLSKLQKQIIEHLRKSVLTTNDGFGVLCSHELQFVERTDK